MYGHNQNNYRSRGGGSGGRDRDRDDHHRRQSHHQQHYQQQQQQQQQQPNYSFDQNLNFHNLQLIQNLAALAFPNPNPNYFQYQDYNNIYHHNQWEHHQQQQQQQQQSPPKQIEATTTAAAATSSARRRQPSLREVHETVLKIQREFVEAGEHVSAWRVVKSVLSYLKVESWESLGFAMQEVDSLNRIMSTEARINAFIHCFVAVQSVTSLFSLERAICKNEGINQFQELELGPILQHPLVLHYFPVNSDVTHVCKITYEQIIVCLFEFIEKRENKQIKTDEFLDFVAEKKNANGKEELGIRIQTLGMHISFISEAKRMYEEPLKKYLKRSTKDLKRPLFSTRKQAGAR